MNVKKKYVKKDIAMVAFNEIGELCYINVRMVKINQNFIILLRRLLCEKNKGCESVSGRNDLNQYTMSELRRIIREVTNVSKDDVFVDPYLKRNIVRRVVFENLDYSLIERADE